MERKLLSTELIQRTVSKNVRIPPFEVENPGCLSAGISGSIQADPTALRDEMREGRRCHTANCEVVLS
jgi:hypothetical protein